MVLCLLLVHLHQARAFRVIRAVLGFHVAFYRFLGAFLFDFIFVQLW